MTFKLGFILIGCIWVSNIKRIFESSETENNITYVNVNNFKHIVGIGYNV